MHSRRLLAGLSVLFLLCCRPGYGQAQVDSQTTATEGGYSHDSGRKTAKSGLDEQVG